MVEFNYLKTYMLDALARQGDMGHDNFTSLSLFLRKFTMG